MFLQSFLRPIFGGATGREGRLRLVLVLCGRLCLLGSGLLCGRAHASDYQVVINELNYHPFGDPELEFVELFNLGAQPVDLAGWAFTQGVEFTFPAGVTIEAGGYVVIARDPTGLQNRFGLDVVFGPYVGVLDNNGEVLAITNDLGETVNQIHYEDDGQWPGLADGRGATLEYTAADNGNDIVAKWSASHVLFGTPGRRNSASLNAAFLNPAHPRLRGVFNEVRARFGGSPSFVEFYNPTPEPLDLGGARVISSAGVSFSLPAATTLASGEHRLVVEDATGAIPLEDQTFVLLLSDGETIVDAIGFEAVAGTSYGRIPDGDGDSLVLVLATPGDANRYEFETPVVINEIYYHPAFVPPSGECIRNCSDVHQWIELLNRSDAAVDISGWRMSKGISFTFPANTTLLAGARLVVAASVEDFQALYPAVDNVVGDWVGRLRHDSEAIYLRDGLGNIVDRVEYGDGTPVNDVEPDDGLDDRTFLSSPWPRSADGDGPSLALLHPELDNSLGFSWRPSLNAGGSPGQANPEVSTSPPPAVGDLDHFPAVPTSEESVTVTCRISSVSPITEAEVRWEVGPGSANGVAILRDDGNSGDDEAGDGVFGATISARTDGDVVAFQIAVSNAAGEAVVLPRSPDVAPYAGFRGPFYLYEVDDSEEPANGNPLHRIIMRSADVEELGDRDEQSDVQLPATFISGEKVRYLVGVRYRGENSRRLDNKSIRVNFRPERSFEGIEHLNLNAANGGEGRSALRELLSMDLFRRSGLPYSQTWPVTLRFGGEVDRNFDTRYIRKEHFDGEFLSRFFGGADGGNLYRGIDPEGAGSGDLSYRGEDPDDYRAVYDKRNNKEEDDYTDIIALTRAFDPGQTPADVFPETIRSLVDIDQWARFFATMSMLGNSDGGIWNRSGEDYFLYRVPEDASRSDAGKFLILPWDVEEAFSDRDERLFRPELPAIRRFLRVPEVSAAYHREIGLVRNGIFSRLEMQRRTFVAKSMYDEAAVFNIVDPIDAFTADRLGVLDFWTPNRVLVGALDGSDGGTPIIDFGEVWSFFPGQQAPPGDPMDWVQLGYSVALWENGNAGFGYGDGDDATVLNDMLGNYTSVFVRREFDIQDRNAVEILELAVDYDDGFVAYLNGTEVARSGTAPGAVGEPVAFDQVASGSREAGEAERFDISSTISSLRNGTNVLALVGFNRDAGSGDFSLSPALFQRDSDANAEIAAGCGDLLYAAGNRVTLSGAANPERAASVRVNGALSPTSYITDGGGPFGLAWSAAVPIAAGFNEIVVESFSSDDGSGVPLTTERVTVVRTTGFTDLSAEVNSDTTWTLAQSPYRLTETIQVTPGTTLTIEPGVAIFAEGDAGLNVRGRLRAEGSEDDPILFVAERCDARWNGIVFRDTGRDENDPFNTLVYCDFRYGEDASAAGFLTPINSKLRVDSCRFLSMDANTIDGNDCELEVLNCWMDGSLEGIHCTDSTATVLDTTIRNLLGDKDAIDFDGDGDARSVVGRCVFEFGYDDGLDLGGNTVDIFDNVFRYIQDKAISIERNGDVGRPTIQWNLIHDCGTGIALKNGVEITDAHHNTVTQCVRGIDAFAKDAGPEGGEGTFHSTIAWSNGVDASADDKSTLAFTFSNVGGDAVWPGEGNIRASPLFTSASRDDFSLREVSPCVGTAQDGGDMGALPVGGAVPFIRGDSNQSGGVNISDAVFTLNHLFLGGGAPPCLDRLDGNDDGFLNITDGVFVLSFLFLSGSPIPPPYPEPGADPTNDDIPCER